jgi:hypothetical protein
VTTAREEPAMTNAIIAASDTAAATSAAQKKIVFVKKVYTFNQFNLKQNK